MTTWTIHRLRARISRLALLLATTILPGLATTFIFVIGILSAIPSFRIDSWLAPTALIGLSAVTTLLIAERHYIERAIKQRFTVSGPYFESNPVHLASAGALLDARPETRDDREIMIATLPGHSASMDSPFSYDGSHPNRPGLSLLMQELGSKILSADGWTVLHVVNITTGAELAGFNEWLDRFDIASGYEVRAYSTNESLPIIAPLIIGRSEVLLGVEDLRKYELKNAIRIEGREIATWVRIYFKDLWDRAPYKIQNARGRDLREWHDTGSSTEPTGSGEGKVIPPSSVVNELSG